MQLCCAVKSHGLLQVATDNDINELMMRTEHEFEMWRQMDAERLQAEGSGKAQLPRLMQVHMFVCCI